MPEEFSPLSLLGHVYPVSASFSPPGLRVFVIFFFLKKEAKGLKAGHYFLKGSVSVFSLNNFFQTTAFLDVSNHFDPSPTL